MTNDSDNDPTAEETPGGGPTRVVSETSVDDILESIESEPAEPNETAPDEDETGAEPEDGGDTDPALESGPVADDDSVVRTADDTDVSAAALADADSELAARVERGDVTGSDVRAAETGEGRERTTDIADIELSVDDLDDASSATQAVSDGDEIESSASVSSGTDHAAGSGESSSDSSGLLARLKSWLSG